MKRRRSKKSPSNATPPTSPRAFVFPSALGWMSLVIDNKTVTQLSFGNATPKEALASLSGTIELADDGKSHPLVRRLQQYAKGRQDNFRDVKIDSSKLTPFQSRVVEICRKIPFGSSLTYGEVAARAGHPRAARAVGSCMRTTRIAIIVPCHRVVATAGTTRGDSACDQMRKKLRRLEGERS